MMFLLVSEFCWLSYHVSFNTVYVYKHKLFINSLCLMTGSKFLWLKMVTGSRLTGTDLTFV